MIYSIVVVKSETTDVLDWTIREICERFGGCTAFQTQGWWVDATGNRIGDESTTLMVHVPSDRCINPSAQDRADEFFRKLAHQIVRDTGETCVYWHRTPGTGFFEAGDKPKGGGQ